MNWDQAQCLIEKTAPETFFPSAQKKPEVCGRCPITEECFDYGLELGVNGWWGGQRLVLITSEDGSRLAFRRTKCLGRCGAWVMKGRCNSCGQAEWRRQHRNTLKNKRSTA